MHRGSIRVAVFSWCLGLGVAENMIKLCNYGTRNSAYCINILFEVTRHILIAKKYENVGYGREIEELSIRVTPKRMCARRAWHKSNLRGKDEVKPRESILQGWEVGSLSYIARVKRGDMMVFGVEDIMCESPMGLEMAKPLSLAIRKTLVPLDEEQCMMIGTPVGDPERLYSSILDAYDTAIGKLP